ncbi:hypothetical protein LX36DRAFT_257414 [Colletotrichum falcatum]|nr:hypothetical protein LX36DRAFT_257414 [Colletotrichum falcatum]
MRQMDDSGAAMDLRNFILQVKERRRCSGGRIWQAQDPVFRWHGTEGRSGSCPVLGTSAPPGRPQQHRCLAAPLTLQQLGGSKRPKPLSTKQHAALREQLQRKQFLQPAWADQTKRNVAGISKKWKRFCETHNLGH